MSKSSVVIALSLTVCMAAVKAIAAGKGVSVKPTNLITYKKIGAHGDRQIAGVALRDSLFVLRYAPFNVRNVNKSNVQSVDK